MELIPDLVREKLNDDEKITWMEKPDPMSAAIRQIPVSLMSIIFFGLAVQAFWVAFNPRGGKLYIEPDTEVGLQIAIIVVFAVIGIVIFLKPIFSYKEAEKTIYCVSNQRAIQIIAKKKTKVISHSHSALTTIKRKDKKNGKSDILYAVEKYTVRRKGRTQHRTREFKFWAIADGDGAEKALIKLREEGQVVSSSRREYASEDYYEKMQSLR